MANQLPREYCPQHVILINQLKQFYRKGKLCDAIVEVDGVKVYCHKVVLSASGNYFRQILSNEVTPECIKVLDEAVDNTILRDVIEYMYTGTISITPDNVNMILQTANHFEMEDLLSLCWSHFNPGESLNVRNCLKSFRTAKNSLPMINRKIMKQFVKRFIADRFLDISKGFIFLNVLLEDLLDILKDDDLNASELEVFNATFRWLRYNFDRAPYTHQVLNTVRFSLIDNGELQHVKNAFHQLDKNGIFSDYIRKVGLKPGKRLENDMIAFSSAIETSGRQGIFMQFFDLSTMKQYGNPPPLVEAEGSNLEKLYDHKLVYANHHIFVLGGANYSGSIDKAKDDVRALDLHTQIWKSKAPMQHERCGHAAVTYQNNIYVFGGKSGTHSEPSSTVEVYNIQMNQWTQLSSMPVGLAYHGAVVHNGLIYVFGGQTSREREGIDLVYQYKIDDDKWSLDRDFKLMRRRYEFGIALIGDVVYISGGDWEACKDKHTMEIINLSSKERRWDIDCPISLIRASAVTLQNNLYVVGIQIDNSTSSIKDTENKFGPYAMWKYEPDEYTSEWNQDLDILRWSECSSFRELQTHQCCVAPVNRKNIIYF